MRLELTTYRLTAGRAANCAIQDNWELLQCPTTKSDALVWSLKTKGGDPGIEPGTSRTLSENHTTRPITQPDVIAALVGICCLVCSAL